MNTETFSLIFLRNIWASRSKRKLPLLAHLVLCAIGQGVTRRRDIIERCEMNEASFYSVIYPMMREGLVVRDEVEGSRMSVFRLTDAGVEVYRRLFWCRKEDVS